MCGKKFNSEDERKQHAKQCKIDTKCKHCFQKCADFTSIHSFHLHCLLCKGGLYQCSFCDDEMFTVDKYQKCKCHFEQCRQGRCLKCQKLFNTQQELKAHGVKKHPKYSCTRFKAFFDSERQLEEHKKKKALNEQ